MSRIQDLASFYKTRTDELNAQYVEAMQLFAEGFANLRQSFGEIETEERTVQAVNIVAGEGGRSVRSAMRIVGNVYVLDIEVNAGAWLSQFPVTLSPSKGGIQHVWEMTVADKSCSKPINAKDKADAVTAFAANVYDYCVETIRNTTSEQAHGSRRD